MADQHKQSRQSLIEWDYLLLVDEEVVLEF